MSTATADTMVTTIEAADLEGLDLLDDDRRHARCTLCTGEEIPLGTPFVAICGRRAIMLSDHLLPGEIPADACKDCVRLFHQPCSRCGT